MKPDIARIARRKLKEFGVEATLYTYTNTGTEDDYGEPDTSVSTKTVTVRVRNQRQPEQSYSVGGEVSYYEAQIFVSSEHRADVTDAADGVRSSEIEVTIDGLTKRYRVIERDPQDNGLLVCWCNEVAV